MSAKVAVVSKWEITRLTDDRFVIASRADTRLRVRYVSGISSKVVVGHAFAEWSIIQVPGLSNTYTYLISVHARRCLIAS